MNRRDDHAGPLFVTDSCEERRNLAHGRLNKGSLRTKEKVKARQHL